ncbi:MAG TPA: hypothetical protein VGO18_05975 [Steroidobacteraceae bacterium]|nr:hypothetical protein [Steroidobacteraceae bacterium]
MKTAARIRFEALSAEWFTETRFQPSDSRICMHPAFLDIVSMGEPAVPFIVESLRKRPSFLTEALRRIVGSLPETSIGANEKIQEAVSAWIHWYDDGASALTSNGADRKAGRASVQTGTWNGPAPSRAGVLPALDEAGATTRMRISGSDAHGPHLT